VLEAEALHQIGQLDVDRQVVGVELELVVGPQAAVGIDLQGHGRDTAVDVHAPVPVATGIGGEIDDHGPPLVRSNRTTNLHRSVKSL
jgi:hypothetical protein